MERARDGKKPLKLLSHVYGGLALYILRVYIPVPLAGRMLQFLFAETKHFWMEKCEEKREEKIVPFILRSVDKRVKTS